MIELGKINNLKVVKEIKTGIYMDGGELGEIFLSKKEVPGDIRTNDNVKVFIFKDSKSQVVVTTKKPCAMAGEFALLKVVTSNSYGAFLEWGLKPDLKVPVREQQKKMKAGQSCPVFIYNDKYDRITASSRLNKFAKKVPEEFREGQPVDLVIVDITPMGYRAIIDGKYFGVLYKNEVFQILKPGQAVKGFIKKIREDDKVDLTIRKSVAMETDLLGKKILNILKERGGSLNISDKTEPEKIYSLFGVSKKRYKNAIGALYKKRLIIVEDHGIRIARKQDKELLKKKIKGRRRRIR
ncbi:S1 RNA-binding domain-containing protein [Thermodesulfobacteriota bacterium]